MDREVIRTEALNLAYDGMGETRSVEHECKSSKLEVARLILNLIKNHKDEDESS